MAEWQQETPPADDTRRRALFLFLMAAAVISFALCVFSDIRMNSTHVPLSDELAVAVTWLVGHGLHGAIVVLLPFAYLLQGCASTSALPDGDEGVR
jgi:hypothetical protein